MLLEEKMKKEAEDELEKLNKAELQVETQLKKDKAILAYAEMKLPDVLVQHALGEIDPEEVRKTKAAIKLLKERLDEAPIIIEEIEKRRRKAHRKIRESERLARKRETYEDLKERLTKYPDDIQLARDLRHYAHELDEMKDAETFIAKIQGDESKTKTKAA